MAKTAKTKSTAVAVQGSGSFAISTALPDRLKGYKGPLGTENIDNADVTIPRLKMAQSLTPEVKDGKLAEGDLFLNVTGQAVWKRGAKALPVIVLSQAKEYILWRPREDNGGGILARAKPVREKGATRYKWDKPNQTFDVKVGGKVKVQWKTKTYIDEDGLNEWGSEIPGDKESGIAATAHHNYAVLLPTMDNVVAALSMSKSGVRKAKDLNAALKMDTSAPIWEKVFELETVEEVGQGGPTERYSNWSMKPAGYIANDALVTLTKTIAASFVERGFTVDQSDDEADVDDHGGKAAGKSGRV
jgi:hypothetical protein